MMNFRDIFFEDNGDREPNVEQLAGEQFDGVTAFAVPLNRPPLEKPNERAAGLAFRPYNAEADYDDEESDYDDEESDYDDDEYEDDDDYDEDDLEPSPAYQQGLRNVLNHYASDYTKSLRRGFRSVLRELNNLAREAEFGIGPPGLLDDED